MDRRDFLKTATTAVGVATTEQLFTPLSRADNRFLDADWAGERVLMGHVLRFFGRPTKTRRSARPLICSS